jgi:hypothetical protein
VHKLAALSSLLLLLLIACGSESDAVAPPSVTPSAADAGDVDAAPPRCTKERTAEDRPDDVDGYQIRVMYVLPSDGQDEELDRNGKIATTVMAWNEWLASQTGGPKLRLDTCDGELDIGFFRMERTEAYTKSLGAFVRERIERELQPKDPKKILAVYYGGGSEYSCGGGPWPPELIAKVAAVYLKGTPPGSPACATNELGASVSAPGYFEFAMIHEIFHGLGAAAECAPDHHLRGHVSTDPTDLMWTGDAPWAPETLDIGRDDYWGHGRADCVDLARSVFVDPLPEGAELPPGWDGAE